MPSRAPIWADGASTALSGGYDSRRARMDRGPAANGEQPSPNLLLKRMCPGIFGTTFGPTKEVIQHGLQGLQLSALLRASPWHSRLDR